MIAYDDVLDSGFDYDDDPFWFRLLFDNELSELFWFFKDDDFLIA